jgi:hypothetical protein
MVRYAALPDEYPCQYYPHYLSGFGYFIDQAARANLLCAFFRDEKPFFISDVYVTGILAEYLQIKRLHIGLQVSYRVADDCESFFRSDDPLNFACASSSHHNVEKVDQFTLFYSYWRLIHANRELAVRQDFLHFLRKKIAD